MKHFNVTIKGTTPLLMNKPPEFGFDDAIRIKVPLDTKKKGQEEALNKLYSNGGTIYTPSTHIWRSMINAGKDLKIKGKGKSTYSKMIASMVQVSPDAIEHKFKEFEIFGVMTVNPNTRGRNMTYRPRFDKWELSFELIVDEEIPDEVVKTALDRSGRYWGIGDWRPEKKGVFGKFMVTKFEENGKL